jgi:hypothetical protein
MDITFVWMTDMAEDDEQYNIHKHINNTLYSYLENLYVCAKTYFNKTYPFADENVPIKS